MQLMFCIAQAGLSLGKDLQIHFNRWKSYVRGSFCNKLVSACKGCDDVPRSYFDHVC